MHSFPARYHDGETARTRSVEIVLAPGARELTISEVDGGQVLDRWQLDAIYSVPARAGALRLGSAAHSPGARLDIASRPESAALSALLPALHARRRDDRRRQLRAMGLATLAVGSVVVAYVTGVPLLARNIVAIIPAEWEQQLGDTVAIQIADALADEGGFAVCDPDSESLANRAIRRFANSALAGTGTAFAPRVTVVRSDIPNAFALPGGQAFYFSALLEKTETADEFAGVLAHELGHVVYRHGLEGLVATSATGLLIGFILGDMTGLSVAGGLGAALIDTRFSREAEREADRFAADVAQRLDFQPVGLADLLDRVSEDDSMSRALALLSTHPLTTERRLALAQVAVPDGTLSPAFTPLEWQAIKAMCDRPGAAEIGEPSAASVTRPEAPPPMVEGPQARQRNILPQPAAR
jgi:predicted Zn-dependent protease